MTVASRARTQMTMRALVQRNGTSTTDSYGHPEAASWSTHIAAQACRVWSRTRREVVDGEKTALVEQIRCAMPLDADVTEDDRIFSVSDRQGTVLWSGPLRIDAIQHKHTHLEMDLRRIES